MPVVVARRNYIKGVEASGSSSVLNMALEQPGDLVTRMSIPVFPDEHEDVDASVHMVGVMVRTYLWQRGGYKLYVAGPPKQCAAHGMRFAGVRYP